MAEKKLKIVKQDGLDITFDGEWGGSGPSTAYLTGATQTSTSTESGGDNVVTFYKSDGSTSTLTVKNGVQGASGITPTITAAAGTNIGTVGTPSVTATTAGTTTTFTFNNLKGATGASGTSVTITSKSVTYQASSNGTTAPTGTWSTSVPTVTKGQFLWSKTVVTYSTGDSTTTYNVGYQGTNGTNATTTSVVSTTANGLAPKVTDTSKFLKGDGTWATPTGFAVSQTLVNSSDLNSVTTPGFYNAAGSNTVSNVPVSGDAFGLIVTHNAGGNYYTQYYEGYQGKRYYRYCENGTWSSWMMELMPVFIGKVGGESTAPNKWRHIAQITMKTTLSVNNDVVVKLKVTTLITGSTTINAYLTFQIRRTGTSTYSMISNYYSTETSGELLFGYSFDSASGLVNVLASQDYGYENFYVYNDGESNQFANVALGIAGNMSYTETAIVKMLDYSPHLARYFTDANDKGMLPMALTKTRIGDTRVFLYSLPYNASNVPNSNNNWTIYAHGFALSSTQWRWSQVAVPNGTTASGNIYLRLIYTNNSGGSITYGNWIKVANSSELNSYLPLSGGTMTGQIVIPAATSGSDLKGLKVGSAGYISSLTNRILMIGTDSLRFSDVSTWDSVVWAGLKYNSTNKVVSLGIADGSVFSSNTAQTGGKLTTPGCDTITIGNGNANTGVNMKYDSTNKCLDFTFN